jgi:hypothetical protein
MHKYCLFVRTSISLHLIGRTARHLARREVWKEPSIEYELHGVGHAKGNAKEVRDECGIKCWYVPWRFDKELTLELSRRRLWCSFRASMIPVRLSQFKIPDRLESRLQLSKSGTVLQIISLGSCHLNHHDKESLIGHGKRTLYHGYEIVDFKLPSLDSQ